MSGQSSDFYLLRDPGSDRLQAVPEDGWGPGGANPSLCIAGGHPRCVTPPGDAYLDAVANVRVSHNKRDADLIWTWPVRQFIIAHDRFVARMQAEGFSGYSLRPATVRFRDGFLSDEYKRLLITAWGGLARPESGVRLQQACPSCLFKSYSPLSDPGELIDRNQWSGEDFFVVWPMPYFIFVTGRLAAFLRSSGLKSFRLQALVKDAGPPFGRSGFGVGSLGENMPMQLALKYGGPLGIV
jgi:hypothetical protein